MYIHYTIYIIKQKITPYYSKSAATGFFLLTQERVRNSRGKRVISVRSTEVLLYFVHVIKGFIVNPGESADNKLHEPHLGLRCLQIQRQSNFNGSNTFGTMKISSRQGLFEPMRVDYSARSGGIIGIIFRFSLI